MIFEKQLWSGHSFDYKYRTIEKFLFLPKTKILQTFVRGKWKDVEFQDKHWQDTIGWR